MEEFLEESWQEIEIERLLLLVENVYHCVISNEKMRISEIQDIKPICLKIFSKLNLIRELRIL